jgi:hypothetical protein
MNIFYYINVHMHIILTHACMPPVGSAEQSAGPRLRSHAGAWVRAQALGQCVHMRIDITYDVGLCVYNMLYSACIIVCIMRV